MICKVGLAPFSRNQLRNFLRIEMPQVLLADQDRSESYPASAAIYRAIRAAIVDNGDAVRAAVKAGGPANQVGDDIGFRRSATSKSSSTCALHGCALTAPVFCGPRLVSIDA